MVRGQRNGARQPQRWFASHRAAKQRRLCAFSLLCCVGALHIASPVWAEPVLDPTSERANALFKKGKQAYEEGKDQESYRLLREAWSLRKSSDIAANLAFIET